MEKVTREPGRLQELSGSHYEMPEGKENIKGWEVRDSNGNKVGKVDELLFDDQALKIRYAVLDLHNKDLDLKDEKVLVPIGRAALDVENDIVLLQNTSYEQLTGLPTYDKDILDKEFETRNFSIWSGTPAATEINDDFYAHEHFNEDNLYRNRRGTDSIETESTSFFEPGDTTSTDEILPDIEDDPRTGNL